ncbi:hypothetical protein WMF27_17145 [Sorangium sp. So ce281]|uniref:hypothetical protein n=1 Tax=unclassified Sorangium TaxID=2621164 RepID=UPI003F64548B
MPLFRARDAGDLVTDQAAHEIVVAHPEHRIMVSGAVGAPAVPARLRGRLDLGGAPSPRRTRPLFTGDPVP